MRGLSAVLFGLACNHAARGEVPGTVGRVSSEVRYSSRRGPHKHGSRQRQTTMLVFDVGWKAAGMGIKSASASASALALALALALAARRRWWQCAEAKLLY